VPATKPSTPVKAKTGKLYIVAGSFGSEKNAQYLQNELSQKGYSGKVIKNPENGMFRVVIETSSSNREADLKKAKQDIAPSVWVLED
jgi:cell division protein FtsN